MAKSKSRGQGLINSLHPFTKPRMGEQVLLYPESADASGVFLFGYYPVSSRWEPVAPVNPGQGSV